MLLKHLAADSILPWQEPTTTILR